MRPAEAFAPGEYIAEGLEHRGETELGFSNALGWTLRKTHAVIYHDQMLEDADLTALAQYFGTSKQLWENMQMAYFDHLCQEIAGE